MLVDVAWVGTKILAHTFTTVFTTLFTRAVPGDASGLRGAAWLWAEEKA